MEDFNLQQIESLNQALTPDKIKALGLPSGISGPSLVTGIIKNLIPNLGLGFLKRIFAKLTGRSLGNNYKDKGIFGKVFHVITRVIDSILGLILGVIGGALVGAAGFGFAGITGGLSGLVTEPTTIHTDMSNSDNYIKHGDRQHSNSSNQNDYNNNPIPVNPNPTPNNDNKPVPYKRTPNDSNRTYFD